MCSSASIFDTTTPFLTTAFQSRSLRESNTQQHALALQFPHHKWTNKSGNREGNSPFITLPLVVLAVMQSSSCAALTHKQWRVENNFVVKNFCR